jgi:hypothetical protein
MPLFKSNTQIVRAQYSFTATGNTTSDVAQVTFEFPGGCLGPNGILEGNLWASCTASANGKRIRAYISNTNNGVSGTRFVNLNIGSQSSTAIVGMRGFALLNKGSQSSQIAHPSASGGTGAATSGFDFENLTIDTAQTFFVTVGLQKDVGTESLQLQTARLTATYIA